jgi:hypothetical protein
VWSGFDSRSHRSIAGLSGPPTGIRLESLNVKPHSYSQTWNWLYSQDPNIYYKPRSGVAFSKLLRVNNITISLKINFNKLLKFSPTVSQDMPYHLDIIIKPTVSQYMPYHLDIIIKYLYTIRIASMHVTCPAHLILFCFGKLSGWPPLWSSGQSSWLQIRRPGFDSRHYQEKKAVGLERGLPSLVSTTKELLNRKVAAPA